MATSRPAGSAQSAGSLRAGKVQVEQFNKGKKLVIDKSLATSHGELHDLTGNPMVSWKVPGVDWWIGVVLVHSGHLIQVKIDKNEAREHSQRTSQARVIGHLVHDP